MVGATEESTASLSLPFDRVRVLMAVLRRWWVLVLAGGGAKGGSRSPGDQPLRRHAPRARNHPSRAAEPPVAALHLGPGDHLELEILSHPETRASTFVSPDGRIYFDLLPGLDVWGLTLLLAWLLAAAAALTASLDNISNLLQGRPIHDHASTPLPPHHPGGGFLPRHAGTASKARITTPSGP